MLALLAAAADLKALPRTGWLLAGVAPVESVADHSFATALLALALARRINADPAAESLAAPLDIARVLRVALVHDLAEATLTDLPRRATELIGEEAKHAAERIALAKIVAGLSDAEAWLADWEEYTAASSPEARLVRDADKLEMAHQALIYARRGHTTLAEFHAPRPYHYAASAALYTEITT